MSSTWEDVKTEKTPHQIIIQGQKKRGGEVVLVKGLSNIWEEIFIILKSSNSYS